jgi:peptidyl-prolyl cis-trans isomerase B (cyclophilin B)
MSDVTPPPAPSAAPQPPPAAPQPPTGQPNVQPISYPAGQRVAETPWNGMAIASLVLSVIGLSLIGVILGHISMSQIKRTGEQGHVLALIGVILGYIGILLWIVFGVFLIFALVTGAYIVNYTETYG